MPNWAECRLTIEDCSPELAAYLQENGLSFDKIKPTPPEKLTDEKGSWYQWRVDNWGTKWDLSEEDQRDVADMLLYGKVNSDTEDADFTAHFDTAWEPPCQAIAALSAMFPNDNFVLSYLELGMMFGGTAHISDGMIHISDVDFDDREAVKQFLIDEMNYPEEDAFEIAGLNEEDEE